jgi:L-asparaginase
VETFKPNELGFLGYADSDGEVVLYRAPLRRHTTATEFQVDEMNALPRVDIAYCYAGSDELLINAVRANGSDGLVLAGFGGGSFPPRAIEAAAQAVSEGMPIVLASRSIAGRVVMTPRKEEQQFIVSDNLQPQKARILLMLALTVTKERKEIQRMFGEY